VRPSIAAPARPASAYGPAGGKTTARSGTAGGTLLAVAGAAILMGIITAEALYPAAYNTHRNAISDLGAMRPHNLVRQPSAAIFNWTMIVTGILVIAAAYCLHRALRRWATSVPVALLGVGILGVGVFPGNHLPEHQLFAMLAFTAGGVAAILSWRVQDGPLRYYSLLLGATALLSLVAGVLFIGWAPAAGLGEGGVERWIAYPVVLWMVSFGASLCHSRRPCLPGQPDGSAPAGGHPALLTSEIDGDGVTTVPSATSTLHGSSP
jgi:hypothetical membrane protein